MITDSFSSRHIGPDANDEKAMLKLIGLNSVDELINQTVPQNIRLKNNLAFGEPMSEYEYKKHIKKLGSKNKIFKNYIGLGYYDTIIPSVTQRNILENPGWYTAYTPYQAEIAQGRLEALLNFQTMVCDLTGMEIANASLLDESTAAAEAMIMLFHSRSREKEKNNFNKFFIASNCFPQTIDLLKTRSAPLGIELVIDEIEKIDLNDNFFGILIQYPDVNGKISSFNQLIGEAKLKDIKISVATDLMSLTLLTPPGEWGADIVFGNSQRFGVPLGYGGPHAAFFASKEEYKRNMPGRIIGVSIDRNGNRALRMALQTREQHIKRDKATSNICTAQALLAIMASMYAVYHGKDGLKAIGERIHKTASLLAKKIEELGYGINNFNFFDTLNIDIQKAGVNASKLKSVAENNEINLRYIDDNTIGISIDETVLAEDLNNLLKVLAEVAGKIPSVIHAIDIANEAIAIDSDFLRSSEYLTHPIFNSHHSETEMMRYIKKLENKDLSLTHSMISLGSCTMKLNAATELYPITYPEFANLHPFAPIEQAQGYVEMIHELDRQLSEITGFAKMSFQPNSGAQGEFAGLMVIREYHISRGDTHRNVVLIPSSAHGTNPASAVMAGMQVVVTKCDEKGNVDVADLKAKAEQYKNNLSCLMVTYPSTHGVFEEAITEITDIIHRHGGLVYMDGANMNAQVGLTSPGNIGADVCHLNLHKTFAIPHGGGGPGMGPIGVAKHLVPFLPGHALVKTGGEKAIHAISGAPFGSALILLISYGYNKMLGAKGVTDATKIAILNANYMAVRLADHFQILYRGSNGRVAHEMIIDCRMFKDMGVEVEDIAKRLMDYGYHAPTMSFPVPGTIMIEPTESESKYELDKFCDALISIRKEIAEVAEGKVDKTNNVLKNAPHTGEVVISDNWSNPYSREKAAYPLSWVREAKFWPTVGRVDNAYGDRNLICTCPPLESYESIEA